MERYEIVIDKYKCGEYEKQKKFRDKVFTLESDVLEMLFQYSPQEMK